MHIRTRVEAPDKRPAAACEESSKSNGTGLSQCDAPKWNKRVGAAKAAELPHGRGQADDSGAQLQSRQPSSASLNAKIKNIRDSVDHILRVSQSPPP